MGCSAGKSTNNNTSKSRTPSLHPSDELSEQEQLISEVLNLRFNLFKQLNIHHHYSNSGFVSIQQDITLIRTKKRKHPELETIIRSYEHAVMEKVQRLSELVNEIKLPDEALSSFSSLSTRGPSVSVETIKHDEINVFQILRYSATDNYVGQQMWQQQQIQQQSQQQESQILIQQQQYQSQQFQY